jgi:hypothetical protein
MNVIGDQHVLDLEGDQDTVAGYHSAFTGSAPTTKGFPGIEEEMGVPGRDGAQVGRQRGVTLRDRGAVSPVC